MKRLSVLWLHLREEYQEVTLVEVIERFTRALDRHIETIDYESAFDDFRRFGPMFGNDWVEWSKDVVKRYDLFIITKPYVRGYQSESGFGGAIGVVHNCSLTNKPFLLLDENNTLYQVTKVEEQTVQIPKTKARQRKFEDTRFVVIEKENFNQGEYFDE